MRRGTTGRWLIIVIILLLSRPWQVMGATLPQEGPVITFPTEGSVVSGEVTIQGTASHPNFSSYGVLYAPGPRPTGDSQWVPIVFGVQTMVVNGPLATWDTTQIPNGQYTLALAVYEVGNDTPFLQFVNNITVQNEEATPTPTPTATPETAAANPTPVPTSEGSIIVPTIEQPPTFTPAPTPDQEEQSPASDEEETGKDESPFPSAEELKASFLAGAWLAVFFYLLGGLYLAGKVAWRRYLRSQKRG